jgi:hypothetical protein
LRLLRLVAAIAVIAVMAAVCRRIVRGCSRAAPSNDDSTNWPTACRDTVVGQRICCRPTVLSGELSSAVQRFTTHDGNSALFPGTCRWLLSWNHQPSGHGPSSCPDGLFLSSEFLGGSRAMVIVTAIPWDGHPRGCLLSRSPARPGLVRLLSLVQAVDAQLGVHCPVQCNSKSIKYEYDLLDLLAGTLTMTQFHHLMIKRISSSSDHQRTPVTPPKIHR